MTTYKVRKHLELDQISEYDTQELSKVIKKYNKWYNRNVKEDEREQLSQAGWAYAIYDIKDDTNQNMVSELSTLTETQGVKGKGYSSFPVAKLFSGIDTIREELLEKIVHPSLLKKEPELLMDILNKLEICTRHVIQNTSIQRLHQKSWVHTDALRDLGGARTLITTDDAVLPTVGRISHPEVDVVRLLRHMKQLPNI